MIFLLVYGVCDFCLGVLHGVKRRGYFGDYLLFADLGLSGGGGYVVAFALGVGRDLVFGHRCRVYGGVAVLVVFVCQTEKISVFWQVVRNKFWVL